MKYFDLLLETASERKKYFENFLEYGKIIKRRARKLLRDERVRVILFGSIVERKHTPLSDIDILIISKNSPMKGLKRGKILAEINKALGLGHPFEIHLIRDVEWKNWYKNFIKKFVEI